VRPQPPPWAPPLTSSPLLYVSSIFLSVTRPPLASAHPAQLTIQFYSFVSCSVCFFLFFTGLFVRDSDIHSVGFAVETCGLSPDPVLSLFFPVLAGSLLLPARTDCRARIVHVSVHVFFRDRMFLSAEELTRDFLWVRFWACLFNLHPEFRPPLGPVEGPLTK